MPERNDWSTCDVCGELKEKIVLFVVRDGLYFEICEPCMVSAQQCFHPTNGGLPQADNSSTPAAIRG
jgi:hypothetical protein